MDTSSPTKNLNNLDEYSKLKIFNYLDVISLLQCTEVSKSWNELIGQKASLMKNVTLHLKNQVVDHIEESDRNYQNLILANVHINAHTLSKLKKILNNVKNLHLKDNVTFACYEIFVEFMSCLNAAKSVLIDRIRISSDSIKAENIVETDIKLKFKYIKICNTPIGDENESPEDFKMIEFLLSHQHSLKTLTIDLPSYRPDLNSDAFVKIVKILCDNYDKLKTIESFTTRLRTFHYRTDFIEFLKCYGPSLKKLCIKPDSDAISSLSPYLMSTIHVHMTLTNLTIKLDEELCDVEEWMENRKNPPVLECNKISAKHKNTHLSSLKLDKIMVSNSDKFFKGFPNIVDLRLELCDTAPRPVEFVRNAKSHLRLLKNFKLLPPDSEETEVGQ